MSQDDYNYNYLAGFARNIDEKKLALEKENVVDHPKHYNVHPSGVECLEIVEHMNFCLGNAIKYIWRADHKENDIVDLKKAIFYLEREIKRRGPSEEERTRKSERCEPIQSNWVAKLREADNQERRLSNSEHFVQHDKTTENN